MVQSAFLKKKVETFWASICTFADVCSDSGTWGGWGRAGPSPPLYYWHPLFFSILGIPGIYVINYLRLFFTETPFERYLYFIAFKHSREETPEYLKFFSSYIDTTPAWEGTGDNSDVLHPSLVASLDYPYFYNHTYVHFLPGGYVNSKTVRMSYLGNSKFTFLNETYVDQW